MKKNVHLYVNYTKPEALSLACDVQDALIAQGYNTKCSAETADIAIGFGGDGTLLRFLRENDYNVRAKYIGINCGTLGFLQNFNIENINEFIEGIPRYSTQIFRLIEIKIAYEDKYHIFKALNEFIIQDENDKTFRTNIHINDEFLENYVGTGMIFSSPTGSTALNYSAGGAIVHPNIETIQMTPREAMANRKMHCLSKSICIPNGFTITLTPNSTENIKIYSDTERVYVGKYDKIQLRFSTDYLCKLSNNEDNFIKTIREKLI